MPDEPEKKPKFHIRVGRAVMKHLEARDKAVFPEMGQTLVALLRQGAKDLQNMVIPAFPDHHVASHEEPGTPFNPTQYEVYQERHETPQQDPIVQPGRKIEMER